MKPWLSDADLDVYVGDCRDVLRELQDDSASCCITSPPYMDARPEYPTLTLAGFAEMFRELRRVVSGPALVNVGRLWRGGVEREWWRPMLTVAARAGFEQIDTLVWIKPNANPIQGQIFTSSHEYVYVLDRPNTKLNVDEIRTPYAEDSEARFGRRWISSISVKGDTSERNGARREERRGERKGEALNPLGSRPRSYVEIVTGREKGLPHPAPMPLELAFHLVKLGCRQGETTIDPFAGGGTTALASRMLGRKSIAIELSDVYAGDIARRLGQQSLLTPEG